MQKVLKNINLLLMLIVVQRGIIYPDIKSNIQTPDVFIMHSATTFRETAITTRKGKKGTKLILMPNVPI